MTRMTRTTWQACRLCFARAAALTVPRRRATMDSK